MCPSRIGLEGWELHRGDGEWWARQGRGRRRIDSVRGETGVQEGARRDRERLEDGGQHLAIRSAELDSYRRVELRRASTMPFHLSRIGGKRGGAAESCEGRTRPPMRQPVSIRRSHSVKCSGWRSLRIMTLSTFQPLKKSERGTTARPEMRCSVQCIKKEVRRTFLNLRREREGCASPQLASLHHSDQLEAQALHKEQQSPALPGEGVQRHRHCEKESAAPPHDQPDANVVACPFRHLINGSWQAFNIMRSAERRATAQRAHEQRSSSWRRGTVPFAHSHRSKLAMESQYSSLRNDLI